MLVSKNTSSQKKKKKNEEIAYLSRHLFSLLLEQIAFDKHRKLEETRVT